MNPSEELLLLANNLQTKTIFHVGNVANNAYNAAAFERSLGLNSYAISPNYYHVMAFPFWENENLAAEVSDHFNPDKFISDFNMPKWFLWGDWSKIVDQVVHEIGGIELTQGHYKQVFKSFLNTLLSRMSAKYGFRIKNFLPNNLRHWIANSFLYDLRKNSNASIAEILNYGDILVFYGPFASLARELEDKRKYLTLEHGTLREWVHSNYSGAKEAKKGYLDASIVFVTNQDCYPAAINMGISPNKIMKTPHPSEHYQFENLRQKREFILKQSNPKTILYPARHSYPSPVDIGKGNEIAIKALVKFVKDKPDWEIRFVEWGDDVNKSKKIIRDFGIEKNVKWLPVLSRKSLREEMANSSLVIDQFKYEAFGAISADAIGIGVPVISKKNNQLDLSFFGEETPIFNALNPEEIVTQLEVILGMDNPLEFMKESISWYDKHLSAEIAFRNMSIAYEKIVVESE